MIGKLKISCEKKKMKNKKCVTCEISISGNEMNIPLFYITYGAGPFRDKRIPCLILYSCSSKLNFYRIYIFIIIHVIHTYISK